MKGNIWRNIIGALYYCSIHVLQLFKLAVITDWQSIQDVCNILDNFFEQYGEKDETLTITKMHLINYISEQELTMKNAFYLVY